MTRNQDEVIENRDLETNTETLQKFFCQLEKFFSKKYEYRNDIYYTAPAWVVNQFFESMSEDKENNVKPNY